MAKKDTQITEESENEETATPEKKPDLTGLVKMHKEGQHIHAHPHVIDEHKKNGWKIA